MTQPQTCDRTDELVDNQILKDLRMHFCDRTEQVLIDSLDSFRHTRLVTKNEAIAIHINLLLDLAAILGQQAEIDPKDFIGRVIVSMARRGLEPKSQI